MLTLTERIHLLPGCSRVLRGELTCATVSCYLPPQKNAWLNKQRHGRLPCWWGVHLTWLVPWKHCCALHLTVLQDSQRLLFTDVPDLLEICRHQSTTQHWETTAIQIFHSGASSFQNMWGSKWEIWEIWAFYVATVIRIQIWKQIILNYGGGGIFRGKKLKRFPIYLHRVNTSTIIFT